MATLVSPLVTTLVVGGGRINRRERKERRDENSHGIFRSIFISAISAVNFFVEEEELTAESAKSAEVRQPLILQINLNLCGLRVLSG
jgi:hypothetical protein